jgi:hypothetical protein
MTATNIPAGLQTARDYIDKLESDGFGWDILVGDAFVRGMRDIGYKSTSYALAELIDNAMQASAKQVDVVFGFEGGNKPASIAIIDDGYGMDPNMARASLVWGAGTRATDRTGFGKYGYGLPSASVSQCRRVTVYSKPGDGEWQSAYLDIDEISEGKWSNGNRIAMPDPKPQAPPAFVVDFLKAQNRWDGFTNGTVVVWDKLDRIDRKQRDALKAELVTDLGILYRGFLVECPLTVDGLTVQPCDPLFLTEGFRYYDLDEDRAVELPGANVEVIDKDTKAVLGSMRVRFSRLPATFFRKPEAKHNNKPGRGQNNERLEIADANNGIIFCRNGRQIDVLRPPRALGNINATTDRFWAVEVDFDASLDEMFSITTAKQQVRPDDRVWDMLKDKAKLFNAIGVMRHEYQKDAATVAAKAEEHKETKRASVEAIEQAAKFRTSKPPKDTTERQQEASENLRKEATRRAKRSGLSAEVVERELAAQRTDSTHDVETEDLPGAPFYRCVQEGADRMLYLNSAHPFYTELYSSAASTPRLRAGLEVLLWSLGNAEVDADPGSDRRMFYERERASVWSPNVADALSVLKDIPVVDTEISTADQLLFDNTDGEPDAPAA